jgi:hypothetical protein
MAAAILRDGTLQVPLFFKSACFSQSVHQIISKSDDNLPTISILLMFKMAAVAI